MWGALQVNWCGERALRKPLRLGPLLTTGASADIAPTSSGSVSSSLFRSIDAGRGAGVPFPAAPSVSASSRSMFLRLHNGAFDADMRVTRQSDHDTTMRLAVQQHWQERVMHALPEHDLVRHLFLI